MSPNCIQTVGKVYTKGIQNVLPENTTLHKAYVDRKIIEKLYVVFPYTPQNNLQPNQPFYELFQKSFNQSRPSLHRQRSSTVYSLLRKDFEKMDQSTKNPGPQGRRQMAAVALRINRLGEAAVG